MKPGIQALFALSQQDTPCHRRAPGRGTCSRNNGPRLPSFLQSRRRAPWPFLFISAVAFLWSFSWPSTPAASAEPIGGFSRQPVVSYRTLSPEELMRLGTWNRSRPDSPLEPARVSSLDLHFLKHAAGGREFTNRGFFWHSPRFTTSDEYEKAARSLAAKRADGQEVRRFRQTDNDVITVETSTGSVVVVAPAGRIKTFFNAAARCSGREPAIRCDVELIRAVRWIKSGTTRGTLAEIDYSKDPLAGAQPLSPLPLSNRAP